MFRKMSVAIFVFALGFSILAVVPRARADDWDQSTKLTFNQPIELPGNHVLPAGTYWFMLTGDSSVSPNTVQVLSADRSQVYGTFLTIAANRPETTNSVQMTFAESKRTQHPAALLRWFYPGHLIGHEFVYSSPEEAKLSASTKVEVAAQNAS